MIFISCLSIYKFPFIKKNFTDHVFPLLETISCSFDSINQPSNIIKVKLEAETICYMKIKTIIMKDDELMSSSITRIFVSLFFDFLSMICLAFLVITVYRFIIIRKIVKEKKISWNFQENLIVQQKNKNNKYLAEIEILIFEQFYEFLFDIPLFLLIILIALFFPWRFYQHYIKKSDKIIKNQPHRIFFKGIADVIGILILLFVFLAFWRWNYLFPAFKRLSKKEKVNIIDQDKNFYSCEKVKSDQKHLVKTMFFEVLKDLVFFLPFVVIMILFIYPTIIYYNFLKYNINSKAHQFQIHRTTAQYCCLFILIHLLILLFGILILVTFVRISFVFKMFNVAKKNKELAHSSIHNYKRNYYEAHIDFINSELLALYFILYDFITLFGFLIVLVSVYRINEWMEKRNLLKIQCDFSENKDREILFESDKNQLIWKLAHQIFLDFISLLIFIILCILILWRIPTFYKIYKNPAFEKEVVMKMSMNKTPFEKQSKISKLQSVICFCFLTMLQDLPYLPIFLISFILMPWRFFSMAFGAKGIFQYDIKESIEDQILQFKQNLIMNVLIKGIKDYICVIETILIVLTFIRLPFFYFLIQKNFRKNKGLSIHQCVHITFKEMIKDLPFFFLGIIVLMIAPWRVYSIMKIVKSVKERIPSFDHEDKTKIKVTSKRKFIWILFLKVLAYDYINIIMITILFLSIYKAKVALKVLKIAWENTYYENPKYEKYDIRKKLTNHVIILFEDSKSVLYVLIILILVIRIEPCYKRSFLRNFDYFINKINYIIRLKGYKSRRKFEQELKKIELNNKPTTSETNGLTNLSHNVFTLVYNLNKIILAKKIKKIQGE